MRQGVSLFAGCSETTPATILGSYERGEDWGVRVTAGIEDIQAG